MVLVRPVLLAGVSGRGEYHGATNEPARLELHPTQLAILIQCKVVRVAIPKGQERAVTSLEQRGQYDAAVSCYR